ncbi:MAG: hypothetical protein ACXAC8_02500 [Candidatus Hodarchaeales archaeon]|jgi:endoglucanase
MEKKINEELLSCIRIPGQSGFENEIAHYIKSELSNYGEISHDRLGSILCKIEGTEQKKGLTWFIGAHMDTCGFIVHSINNSGGIKCLNFGYQNVSACNLQPVAITTRNGLVQGVMHSKKVEKSLSFTIDIGVQSPKKASDLGIIAGDPVHFTIEPFLAGDPSRNIICSPRLDNRLGIFELLLLGKQLKKNPPSEDVYLVATVEEETGLRGAKTAANKIQPDLAIILDVTYDEFPVSMGNGPVITLSDKSVLLSPMVRDFLLELAKKNNISLQTEVWNIGATDAGSVRISSEGVPTIPVLTSTKNNHTPLEMGCIDDCYSVASFCQAILQNGEDLNKVFHS